MGDNQKGLNDLLKWSIANTTPSTATAATAQPNGDASTQEDPTGAVAAAAARGLNPESLKALFGGPSDADLMLAAVAHIRSTDPEVTLESKLTAFDNLEQLIESLDNANLLSKLGLWTPLLELLAHEESEIRLMACWVVGTAVQNNEPSQERLVALGGVERLAAMALGDRLTADGARDESKADKEGKDVRRKAVYALSSACRNYQPGMDVLTSELSKRGEGKGEKIDATDMEAVNVVIDALRTQAQNA
ncbi:Hsp70 nucleotide exchange factor FES1 [Apiospora hydei]|uniref:Hsp70 nucleotide exchange factor FES1 n=1 Tax=Apiospora hydei TaxID=1337664 RepID=A0ABR1V588_9PEZI